MKREFRDPLPHATRRIVLRRLAPTDLAAFQAYRHDPDVGQYQGWVPQSDIAALGFLIEMESAPLFRVDGWCQIGIAARKGNELIGDIGFCICVGSEDAEIGFSLRPESQGEGLATEAVLAAFEMIFEHTSVTRILGITDVRNTRSIKLLERVGMSRIELARDDVSSHSAENGRFELRSEACVEQTYAINRENFATR